MKRCLANCAVVISALLLFMAVLSSLNSTLRFNVVWGNPDHGSGFVIWLYHGQLNFQNSSRTDKFQEALSNKTASLNQVESHFIGIYYLRVSTLSQASPASPMSDTFQDTLAFLRPWPIILFAVLPIISLIYWLCHRHKILPGHCRVCGYDLRATPDRCPECGTLPTSAKGAAV